MLQVYAQQPGPGFSPSGSTEGSPMHQPAPNAMGGNMVPGGIPGATLPGNMVPGGAVPTNMVPGGPAPGNMVPGGPAPAGAMPGIPNAALHASQAPVSTTGQGPTQHPQPQQAPFQSAPYQAPNSQMGFQGAPGLVNQPVPPASQSQQHFPNAFPIQGKASTLIPMQSYVYCNKFCPRDLLTSGSSFVIGCSIKINPESIVKWICY